MGLFSSDNDAEQSKADTLIQDALNDSVDENKLTQLKSGGNGKSFVTTTRRD